MEKKFFGKTLIVGLIILFVGASVIPSVNGTNIRSIEDNERVYALEDMNYVKNPLAKGVVFEDDFDTGNTPGQDPVGWGVSEFINSEVAITGATYVSSPYSVELYNPADSGINIWHGFTSLSEGAVECHVKSSDDGCFITTSEEENPDPGDWGILVAFWNGKIMYLGSSGWEDLDPPFTYTPNTWYHFRFEFDCGTDTYDIYIDDDLKKQDASMKTPLTYFGYIWISCEYTYACTAYLDNVKISEANDPPNTPGTPLGPTTLGVGESGTYSTSATDPEGDQVQYRFDWDDGTISDWTDLVNSGATASQDYSWDTVGAYVVKAQARDEQGGTSDWSSGLAVVVNDPPATPDIDGETNGKVGTEHEYTFVSTDPNGDMIKYIIDWGDNTTDTTELYDSGVTATISHTWNTKGTYIIKAKAADEHDAESDWGTLEVAMPRDKITINSLLSRLLERFPNAFPLLRHLLGL